MPATRLGLPKNPFTLLSKREQEVLRLVAHDRTDRQIARELGIRERTVRAHVGRIILKLDVASRVGAAVAFVTWSMQEEACQDDSSSMSEGSMAHPRPTPPS